MRITQKEIESLGWSKISCIDGNDFYTNPTHKYALKHTHKRDIINIFDNSEKTKNQIIQSCYSIYDVKQLMKSLNIPYENN